MMFHSAVDRNEEDDHLESLKGTKGKKHEDLLTAMLRGTKSLYDAEIDRCLTMKMMTVL